MECICNFCFFIAHAWSRLLRRAKIIDPVCNSLYALINDPKSISKEGELQIDVKQIGGAQLACIHDVPQWQNRGA